MPAGALLAATLGRPKDATSATTTTTIAEHRRIGIRSSTGVPVRRPLAYGLTAGSQCSAILPFSIRNMSNHVVVYFFVASLGSACSRAKLSTT